MRGICRNFRMFLKAKSRNNRHSSRINPNPRHRKYFQPYHRRKLSKSKDRGALGHVKGNQSTRLIEPKEIPTAQNSQSTNALFTEQGTDIKSYKRGRTIRMTVTLSMETFKASVA